MAFVNEKLTLEQRDEFLKRGIKTPRGGYNTVVFGISPLYITIDRENDIWLAWYYMHRETDKNYQEFMFMYKNHPIPLQCYQIIENNHIYWNINHVEIFEELSNEIENIKKLIVEAFKVYNVSGWPGHESLNNEVDCSFAERVDI